MDVRKLENLEAFAKFFDFVSNPDEYKATIEEAKKVVADFNEMTLKARGIREVDVFRAEELAKLKQREDAIAAKAVEVDASIKEKRELQAGYDAKMNERQNDIARRMQEVMKLRGELEDVQAKRGELNQAVADYNQELSKFLAERAAFDAKVAAFEKLVRG